jgi:hypothetical protein
MSEVEPRLKPFGPCVCGDERCTRENKYQVACLQRR